MKLFLMSFGGLFLIHSYAYTGDFYIYNYLPLAEGGTITISAQSQSNAPFPSDWQITNNTNIAVGGYMTVQYNTTVSEVGLFLFTVSDPNGGPEFKFRDNGMRCLLVIKIDPQYAVPIYISAPPSISTVEDCNFNPYAPTYAPSLEAASAFYPRSAYIED